MVPYLLDVMLVDRDRPQQPACVHVLAALQSMAEHVRDHLHMLVPALARLVEGSDMLIAVRIEAIATIEILAPKVDLTVYASALVLALVHCLAAQTGWVLSRDPASCAQR